MNAPCRVLYALLVLEAGCVLDWGASWPDARRLEAGAEARVDRGGEVGSDLRSDQPTPAVPEVWIDIAPGDFVMGSPVSVPCRVLPSETPQLVRLAHAYQISSTETTQDQFLTLMGYTSLRVRQLDHPISKLTWHEATAYCNALSARDQRDPCYNCVGEREKVSCQPIEEYRGDRILTCPGYRLPTEAEWEHAYRAGSTGPLYLPAGPKQACLDENPVASAIGWYAANSGGNAHPVAAKQANAWGIHDLAGNVREWCIDQLVRSDLPSSSSWIDPVGTLGPFRTLRGGSYLDPANQLRAAARSPIKEAFSAPTTGFRCVRTIPRLFSGVIDKMQMPTVPNEFALDLEGKGQPKNALGTMMAMMTALGLRFQDSLDNDLLKGFLIVLFELHADEPVSGTRAIGQLHLGADLDGDPKNNFSGSVLAIKNNNPPGLHTKGSVIFSNVSLRGTVPFPLPLTLNAPTTKVLTLTHARIEGKIDQKGVTGIIAGGVTQQDFDGILVPAVAETLTWAIGPTSSLPLKDRVELAKAVDANEDGQITVAEISQNPLWALIKPDLDLDGDSTPDAFSMGAAFRAVPCTIKR